MMSKRTTIILGLLLLVLVIGLIILYSYTSSLTSILMLLRSARPTGPINASFSLLNTGVLSYNNSRGLLEYAQLGYNVRNITASNITFNVYNSNPSMNVYLLNVKDSCFKCINEDDLYQDLLKSFAKFDLIPPGTSIYYINVSQTPLMPPNSLVIIPSGLMLSCLLPYVLPNSTCNIYGAGSFTIINMLNRGDTVLYVGANFSLSSQNQVFYETPNSTNRVLGNALIVTVPNTTVVPSNILYFHSPTFRFAFNSHTRGPVTYINSENGSLIAFSNYPVSAWPNASAAATDIARYVFTRAWIRTLSYGAATLNSTNGTITVFSASRIINTTPGVNYEINNSYSLLRITLNNSNSSLITSIPFTLHFENNGTIGLPSVIGETQTTLMRLRINNATQKQLLFSIEVYNRNLQYIYSIPIGFFNVTLGVDEQYPFSFANGYYIATLRDDQNRPYESALFYVANAVIRPVRLDFKNGTFVFNVESNGRPVSGVEYSAKINGAYNESGPVQYGQFDYTLPHGAVIKYGPQTFTFTILGLSYTYSTPYQSITGGIPTFYIEFGIAAIVIIFLNLVIRTPIRDEYYIDVPNFPLVMKTEATTDAASIVNIFDTVNLHYHWKYMPLTAEEIKVGIGSNIRHNNMPISITLQNAVEVLYKLTAEGKVETIGDHYMPKRWSQFVKHDIEYLVIFRKLRDYSVEHAILFTDLDQGGNADMIMTSKGAHSYIFIYSGATGMRDIKIDDKSKIYIVFLNSETKAEFLDKLYSSYSEDSAVLRISIASSVIKLIDTENLTQLLY